MPPKTKPDTGKKKGKRDSIAQEVIEETEIKETISFKIHSINNITNLPVPYDIKLTLSLVGDIIGEKSPYKIENEEQTTLEVEFTYKTSSRGVKLYQTLLNNPFFFTVSALNVQLSLISSTQGTAKTKGTTAKSGASTKGKATEITIGSAAFDVLPLLLGTPDAENILVLENQEFVQGSETKSWPNLPFLTASANVIGDILTSEKAPPVNIIYITLESLYNFPASIVNLSTALTFPLYDDGENEIIRFENCKYKDTPCPDEKKRWGTLPNITGRAGLTDYLLSKNNINNGARVDDEDLKNLSSYPRLEWNAIQRCWLLELCQEKIINRLTKYRCWPVEIFINDVINPKGTKSKSKAGKDLAMLMSKTHFVAYLDVTKLLYPGIDNVRVTSQLYTYVKKDLVNKSGQEISFFDKTEVFDDENPPTAKSEPPKTAKKPKSPTRKSKGISEEEEISLPIFTEDGKPAFVTMQIQVMKPFVRKKTEEELEESVMQMIPRRPPPSTGLVNSERAQKEFTECIEGLTYILDKHFQEFCKTYNFEKDKDVKRAFLTYIEELGVTTKLINTLRDRVIDAVKFRIGLPPKANEHELSFENYISDVYDRIVEQMLTAVNSITDGHLTSQRASLDPTPIQVTPPELCFFALEAIEEGCTEKAKVYLLKRLTFDKENPEFWLDLAVLMVRIDDLPAAFECVREVIILDSRHKLGLLMYGILLCMKDEYEEAEVFFDCVTTFYPRFIEGWITFHLFYVHLQKEEGVDATFAFAKKNEEFGPTILKGSKKEQVLLSWCPHLVISTPTLYLITAHLLLRLNCFMFVEMCLAKELETCKTKEEISASLLYCMAVCDYKRGQYEQAVSHLEAALCLDWMLPQLHCLIGHCYYKMSLPIKALESYNIVLSSEDTPKDLHLTNLRAGFLLIENESYTEARIKFIFVCKLNPTPQTWLGLGISCYRLKHYQDAECALGEANMLDNEMPLVWAYLAMNNLMIQKKSLFLDCYHQARRFGLDDEKILQEIEFLKQSLLRNSR